MAQMVLTDIKLKITHTIPLSMLWTTGLSPLIRSGVFSHTDQPFSWHDPSNSESLGRRKPSLKTDASLSIQLLINCSAFVGGTKSKPLFWYSTDSVTEEYQYLLVFSHPSPVLMCITVSSERAEDPAFPLAVRASTRTWGQRSQSPMVWHHERTQRSQGHVRGGGDTTMTKWHGMDTEFHHIMATNRVKRCKEMDVGWCD